MPEPSRKSFIERAVSCPVCQKKFSALSVRSSAYQAGNRDADFRVHYEGVNPVCYAVWVCPSCGYSAYAEDFDKLTTRERESVWEYLKENSMDVQAKIQELSGERALTASVKSYEMAIPVYTKLKKSSEVVAGMYLRMAWVWREQGDGEKEKAALRSALSNYLQAFEHESHIASKLGEGGMMYLIGELHRRIGEFQDAVRWFSRAVEHPDVKKKPGIESLCREQWEKARDALREQREAGEEPAKFIPFSVPSISEDDVRRVRETLKSGWLTRGSQTEEFEKIFKETTGCAHALALNSCTSALHLSLLALDVKEGDEVITTPFTFAASVNAIAATGAKPVFADIFPDTMDLNPEEVREKITPRTKAILSVDFAGQPADLDPLLELASEKNVVLIEDAAHALGSAYKGKTIGSISPITCFSFYATKNITTGEGGMFATSLPEIYEKVKLLSNHGISRTAYERESGLPWEYDVLCAGLKFVMGDVQASLGLSQIQRLSRLLARRRDLAAQYAQDLKEVEELDLPVVRPGSTHTFHLYVIQLKLNRLSVSRDEFAKRIRKEGVGVGVHYKPAYAFSFYKKQHAGQDRDFPVSETIYQRVLSLPIFGDMTFGEVHFVSEKIKKVVSQCKKQKSF